MFTIGEFILWVSVAMVLDLGMLTLAVLTYMGANLIEESFWRFWPKVLGSLVALLAVYDLVFVLWYVFDTISSLRAENVVASLLRFC